MYSIGELSKIVKLSVDALRYYDEIGLLKPHRIDADTRYRTYTDEQLKDLLEILEWKQYGFRLEAIAELLHCTDEGRVRAAMHERLVQLEEEHARLERSIKQLAEKIDRMEGQDMTSGKRILLIDDAAFMRSVLKEILQKAGWTVVGEAADGEHGIACYKELRPDLVLLDIGMPGLNGLEAAREIRAFDSDARMVMCSARGQAITVLESLRAGAAEFVVKPFHQDRLLAAVHRTLEGKPVYADDRIASLLSEERFHSLDAPLAQGAIQTLLDYCSKDSAARAPLTLQQLLERIRPAVADADLQTN